MAALWLDQVAEVAHWEKAEWCDCECPDSLDGAVIFLRTMI